MHFFLILIQINIKYILFSPNQRQKSYVQVCCQLSWYLQRYMSPSSTESSYFYEKPLPTNVFMMKHYLQVFATMVSRKIDQNYRIDVKINKSSCRRIVTFWIEWYFLPCQPLVTNQSEYLVDPDVLKLQKAIGIFVHFFA